MNKITILCISDTHSMHRHKFFKNLPPADIIIHAGDMTSMGYEEEIKSFMKWFSSLSQYKYRICTAGNHDWLFEKYPMLAKDLIPENVIYLEDSGIEIEGLNFYGSPVSLPFNAWAFNRPEYKLEQHWKAIPDNIDVLITHSPQYLVNDYVKFSKKHVGSMSLYIETIQRIQPIVSVSGHVHDGRGIKVIENTTFINASILDDKYLIANNPILVEIDENRQVKIIQQ